MVDHFPLYFTVHGLYKLMNTEPMVFPYIYISVTCRQLVSRISLSHIELLWSFNVETLLVFRFILCFVFYINLGEKKTRSWIWFYHHVRKFFMYVQGTKRMTQFSFYVECINKKELKKETTTSYPVDEQRTREQERGFGVGGEGRNSRRTVYSFYIYI